MSLNPIRLTRAMTLVIMLALFSPLPAQDIEGMSIDQQIEVARNQTEADRQLILNANLSLTEEESRNFWPVYRAYRNEAMEINDGVKDLVIRYSNQYDNLSGEEAYSLVSEIFPLQMQQAELKKKYLERFSRVLSPMNAARAMQIENKLDALLLVDLAAEIPVVSSP